MAKSNHNLTPLKNEQGQISIFFSASIIVLISIIAFVINVGLFVKAKINLQNATDAAAFAGASVQARQLTKIGYLNWEMRNIFKEWMYKYYVIGNLNVRDVENPDGSGPMSFRLEPDRDPVFGRAPVEDPYNLPTICIHLAGSQTNICRRYSIPGLPEFGSSNLPGAEEASRAFMDVLIGTKVNDCIDRTRLNMLVATTWAYNVLSSDMDETLVGQGPAILADRQGAWPRAVELAMRMRNLEYVMNRPAITEGVCAQTGDTSCKRLINDVVSEKKLGNERLIKAFYSGYRNLGNSIDDEMKKSFTLTEIPPRPLTMEQLGGRESASYLLIPDSAQSNYLKQYVDLKLMMVNYATFYAAMIPRGTGDTSGACDVSRVAIPVPGYPMGYYKNPDLVTYYAVKGEALFKGMFNPFGSEPIKLTAYSAAKPFGGRIGPMLFVQRPGSKFFTGRTDTENLRSVPYISSLDLVGTPKRGGGGLQLGEFTPGSPLPINFGTTPPGFFWLENSEKPLGGLVADESGVQFGIPNLVYDYQTPFSKSGYTTAADRIHIIKPGDGLDGDKEIGLFSKYQFKKFKGNIGGVVSKETLENEIARVRAPTLYESANYLIPSPADVNRSLNVDSFGFVSTEPRPIGNDGLKQYTTYVYAPLYRKNDQNDVLFNNESDVVKTIFDFMRAQKSGIDKYRNALNQGAVAIYNMRNSIAGSAAGSAGDYEKAAMGVSDINLQSPDIRNEIPGSCKSLAGQFLYFYYGAQDLYPGDAVKDNTGCPTPLGDLLTRYFASAANDPNYQPTHYKLDYSYSESILPPENLFSAYMPGPFTGANLDGQLVNPISGAKEASRRNFYSTKFVTLDSLRGGPGYAENVTNFVIYSEGSITTISNLDRAQTRFENTLTTEGTDISDGDLNSIKH